LHGNLRTRDVPPCTSPGGGPGRTHDPRPSPPQGCRAERRRGPAARAVLTHALETLGCPRVIAEIDETNRASIAVATGLGLRRFATVQGRLGPLLRYTT